MTSRVVRPPAGREPVQPFPSSPEDGLTPKLMTAQQVGELLNGVPASTVHAWARSGYLPSIKIGRHRRFVPNDILGFIERRRASM